MIRTGITGGIGSGKSVVCRIFELLDVPVYDADKEAKNLYVHPDIRRKMIRLFGKDIYESGVINRKKLAGLIFRNKEMLARVNEIIHPAVAEHFTDWCKTHTDHALVVMESAILFESNAYKMMDRYATVTAPYDIRLARIMNRPGMTGKIAERIMANQLSDEARINRSHHVIFNDNIKPLLPQVLKLHEELVSQSRVKK